MAVFYIYSAISIIICLYFVKKYRPAYPVVAFVVSLFVFLSDVGNIDGVKISIGGAFDLQPLRIIFLFSGIFLIIDPLLSQYRKKKEVELKIRVVPTYERFMIAYLLFTICSFLINYSVFETIELITSITAIASFVLVYFAVKRAGDRGFVLAFKNSLFAAAALSSLVALFQFVGDQSFFRVNPEYGRGAFGGLIRSTGVYRDDYIHAYVVFSALVWLFFSMNNSYKKYALMSLYLIGIFVGFMRMGYVVTAFFFVHAILYASTASNKLKILIVSLSLVLGVFMGFGILGSGILESDAAQERMMDEGTMEYRFQLYKEGVRASFDSMKSILFGYGSVGSPAYYEAMYIATGGKELWATGEAGSWHNLLVEILFFNGLPTALLFLIFLIFLAKYYRKASLFYNDSIYYIPFYILLGYMFANLTLDLGLENPFATILAITSALAINTRTWQVQFGKANELYSV